MSCALARRMHDLEHESGAFAGDEPEVVVVFARQRLRARGNAVEFGRNALGGGG
jgi:hypothetical protein